MILATFAESEAPAEYQERGITAYRWALETSGRFFGFTHQYKRNGEWIPCLRYAYVSLNGWEWGRSHAYYDGPHDRLSLGFLHLSWSLNWCERCVNGE